MKFSNGERSLTVKVLGYEFPDRTGGGEEYDYDANWLVLEGVYNDGKLERSFINSCLLTCELQALAAGLKLLTSGVQDVYQSEFNDPYFEVTAELVGINQYLLYASFSMLVAEDRWQNFGTECFMTGEELKALIADIESELRAFPEKL